MNILLYSRHPAASIKFKCLRQLSQNLLKTMKIYEGFFVRLSFHLMHQSRLKVRANNQFKFVDNDAQHTRGPFPNHSFLFLLHCLDYSVFTFKLKYSPIINLHAEMTLQT